MKQVNEKSQKNSWALLVFLLALSLTVWSCGADTSADEADAEETEMTADSTAMDSTAMDSAAIDSTAMDSTEMEHPSGGEHPSN